MMRRTGSTTRHRVISKKSIQHEFRGGRLVTIYLSAGKQQEQLLAAQKERRLFLQERYQARRNATKRANVKMGNSAADVDTASRVPPSGDEGPDTRHEGEVKTTGVVEAVERKIEDGISRAIEPTVEEVEAVVEEPTTPASQPEPAEKLV